MKKKIIFAIIVVLTLVIGIVSFIFFNNRTVSTITLDINPSIEINLTKNQKVKSVIALNEDAKEIVSGNLKGKSLDGTLKLITDNLIEKGYANEDELLEIILYSEGKISNKELETKLNETLKKKQIASNIITVDEISKEDKELAKKYNVSPAKISYTKTIIQDSQNINFKDLANKSVSELKQTKETGKYCEEGYTLEGDWCLKEKERVSATSGEVCPRGYLEYDGKCYEETSSIEGNNYTCRDEFKLVGDKCIREDTYDALGKCDSDNYDNGYCVNKEYIGDAIEFCRDSGRTLYNHKCLATKPSINGGCLNGDMYYNGKCLNTVNDYYMAEWKCPDGKNISNPDGTIQNEDKKCYKETKTKPISYYCENNDKLNGTKCEIKESENAQKERVCPSGYSSVYDSRCINYHKIANKESGLVCEGEHTKLKGNSCIIYDAIEAKKY